MNGRHPGLLPAMLLAMSWLLAGLNPAAGQDPAAAQELTHIAIMTPEQGTDYGWNQQGLAAARAAAAGAGLTLLVAEGLGYGDPRPVLRELAEDGAGLMIAHASGYNTAAPEIAAELGVPVAIVDRPGESRPGLVADYTLHGHEGAWLAGWLAASMSRSGKVGIVVSGEPPSWNSQSAGFALGARAAAAGTSLIYAVIGPAAYSDAAGARRVTESVIAAGADVIFGQGNGSSFGMIQAVESSRAGDGGKVWFIDVIGDKSALDKGHLLSSVLWDLEPVYTAMIADLRAGRFGRADYGIGVADRSVRLLRTPHVTGAMWARLEAVRDDIVAGRVTVPLMTDARDVRALMSQVRGVD